MDVLLISQCQKNQVVKLLIFKLKNRLGSDCGEVLILVVLFYYSRSFTYDKINKEIVRCRKNLTDWWKKFLIDSRFIAEDLTFSKEDFRQALSELKVHKIETFFLMFKKYISLKVLKFVDGEQFLDSNRNTFMVYYLKWA